MRSGDTTYATTSPYRIIAAWLSHPIRTFGFFLISLNFNTGKTINILSSTFAYYSTKFSTVYMYFYLLSLTLFYIVHTHLPYIVIRNNMPSVGKMRIIIKKKAHSKAGLFLLLNFYPMMECIQCSLIANC